MTQIDFYFNAASKYRLAVRLGAKSLEQATRMFVLTPDAAATAEMEHLFWTSQQTSFLPHCRSRHPLAAETSLIVDHDDAVFVHDDILLNLRQDQPAFFSRFQRLIEIVGMDDADKAAARVRYKFYRDRGYEIRQHDMSGKQL
jgi:DNA polymerase-3 subunit chi